MSDGEIQILSLYEVLAADGPAGEGSDTCSPALLRKLRTHGALAKSFSSHRLSDLAKLAATSQWVVPGYLERGTVAFLYGKPSSMKSFVALDTSLRLTAGADPLGRAADPAPTVYFAGEGQSELARRVLGAASDWGGERGQLLERGFELVSRVPNLLDPQEVDDLIKQWDAVRPGLITIDTFALAVAGANEDSSGEMGPALLRLKQIATELGCAVLVIHHTVKSGEHERGSSAIRAAADVMLRADRPGKELSLRLTMDKSRGAEVAPVVIQLAPVTLDGDLGATLRVVRLEQEVSGEDAGSAGNAAAAAWAIRLRGELERSGHDVPAEVRDALPLAVLAYLAVTVNPKSCHAVVQSVREMARNADNEIPCGRHRVEAALKSVMEQGLVVNDAADRPGKPAQLRLARPDERESGSTG